MALADFMIALEDTTEIELRTVGRVSHRETSRPVWFVRHDDRLYLLPITGSDSQWYKNVVTTPRVHLAADGAEYHTVAQPITDPDLVRGVVDEFRDKYGAAEVAKYYSKTDVAVEAPLA